MPTYTPYHELTRPVPRDSVDRNIWGGQLNETIDKIDRRLTLHGTLANRPSPGVIGRKYLTTDESPPVMYVDLGASWEAIGSSVDELNQHTANTSNPHAVTATQAGALPDTGGAVTGDVTLGGATADAALIHGVNPSEAIVETTAPKGFGFSGSETRDLLVGVDVTIANGGTASVTENVTVSLYDGTNNTGTLVATETKSVTVAAGASSTTGFLAFRTKLDTGAYFIEVVQSGTALAVNQTAANTRGATYRIDQNASGDLVVTDFSGAEVLRIDASTSGLRTPSISSPALPAGGRFLDIEGGNNDVDLWHIGLAGDYGYYLRYVGSASANDNALELWTDGQAGADTRVYRALQDGSINYTGDLRSGGMGVARVNGYSSPRTIYQQTTAPTGGTAGDIWFEL